MVLFCPITLPFSLSPFGSASEQARVRALVPNLGLFPLLQSGLPPPQILVEASGSIPRERILRIVLAFGRAFPQLPIVVQLMQAAREIKRFAANL
jgi:hypothetical protein